MATLKQKKLAKGIVEALGAKETPLERDLLVNAGYDETTARASPKRTIEQKGVQSELKKLGFSEDGAKKVVEDIMYNVKVNPTARLQATRQVFEVVGSFAPEKRLVITKKIVRLDA